MSTFCLTNNTWNNEINLYSYSEVTSFLLKVKLKRIFFYSSFHIHYVKQTFDWPIQKALRKKLREISISKNG